MVGRRLEFLTASEDFGGQGLPHMLNVAALEMWNSGSMAFALGPTLTMGAVDALSAHGSDALKQKFLHKMVSGEWMATMNLTEPHAGSDLGVMKSRAERRDDGTYRIFGQKIYITWGEHEVPTISSISFWHACPMRRRVRAVSPCSWCRNILSATTARSAPATISIAIPSSTSSASTALPPAP